MVCVRLMIWRTYAGSIEGARFSSGVTVLLASDSGLVFFEVPDPPTSRKALCVSDPPDLCIDTEAMSAPASIAETGRRSEKDR